MAKYTVFDSVNMASTHYAKRILDATCDEAIENGTFGYLDGLAEGETVVYKFKKGSKKGAEVVVVDQPCLNTDFSKIVNQSRDRFINEAGTRFRVRVIAKGDDFGITAQGITSGSVSQLKEKAFLTIDESTGKLIAKGETTPEAIMEAVVERTRSMGSTLISTANKEGKIGIMYEAKVKVLA